MKISELISIPRKPVTKSRNLDSIAWHQGYMVVKFFSGPALYLYGPEIPEAELHKIMRVPYPDALFQSNIKNRYKCHKVER
jgi:hypothetical protein